MGNKSAPILLERAEAEQCHHGAALGDGHRFQQPERIVQFEAPLFSLPRSKSLYVTNLCPKD